MPSAVLTLGTKAIFAEKFGFLTVGGSCTNTLRIWRCAAPRHAVDSKKELRNWAVQGKVISDAVAICSHCGRYRPGEQLRLSCYSM
jgi:hypothetical protein